MKTLIRPLLVLALLSPAPSAFAQGLLHAKQIIFGMDCAPCAYGIEKGLKRLPGIESVKVSLNEGYAEVTATQGASVSLAQIREVIRDNGFTPKDVHVVLEGMLQLTPPQLVAGVITYPLVLTGKTDIAHGQRVKLTGVIAADATQVQVEEIEPLPGL